MKVTQYMDVTLNLRLSESTHDDLTEIAGGNVSKTLREIFTEYVSGKRVVKKQEPLSVKTTCTLDLELAVKLSAMAKELGIPNTTLARMMLENYLQERKHAGRRATDAA